MVAQLAVLRCRLLSCGSLGCDNAKSAILGCMSRERSPVLDLARPVNPYVRRAQGGGDASGSLDTTHVLHQKLDASSSRFRRRANETRVEQGSPAVAADCMTCVVQPPLPPPSVGSLTSPHLAMHAWPADVESPARWSWVRWLHTRSGSATSFHEQRYGCLRGLLGWQRRKTTHGRRVRHVSGNNDPQVLDRAFLSVMSVGFAAMGVWRALV